MPKVLIVIARLNVGGTAQYISELTTGLQSKGYEVLVATGFVQGAEVEDKVADSLPLHRVATLGRKISPLQDWRARKELAQLIQHFNPDVIYSHTFKAGLIARTIATDIPRIHAFHGHLLDEPELRGWKVALVKAFEAKLAQRSNLMVTVGKRVAQELLDVGVGSADKYRSIAPGVRALNLADRDQVLKEFGLQNEKRSIVVWMARVTAVKAPLRVIELAKHFPESLFLMAGGGDLFEEVKKDAPENLRVLGWQSAEKMWAIADIAISTSENEGMPVALIEAQLAGVPVVAMSVGSVEEVIQDGQTGFVVAKWGDEYFAKLEKVIQDRDLRNKMSQVAKEYSSNSFAPERLISDHIKLFDEVLK